jgi:hypothetical protein
MIKKIWSRIFGKKIRVSDEQRIRSILVDECRLSYGMSHFLSNAVNRGRSAKITIEVDGETCEVGIMCRADDGLMEYLANWACSKAIVKVERLSEYDRETAKTFSGVVEKGKGPNYGPGSQNSEWPT